MTFELKDHITLGIDTHLLINWPKPSFATLPVSLALSVINFRGTVAIELVDSSLLSVSILDDYSTEFDVRSLLGHRTKIKDLPKLTELLTTRLRALFEEKVVEPRCFRWNVPDIVPREERENDGHVGSERRGSGFGERSSSPGVPERGRMPGRFDAGTPGVVPGHPHLRTSHSRNNDGVGGSVGF